MKHLARTLAAALATIVLSAHAAMADTYQEIPNLPCLGCNDYPKPGLPDILGQSPKFEAHDRRRAEQAPMRPSAPGAPSTHRQR
jgi:hypothetical protein